VRACFGSQSARKLNFVFLHKKINLFLASHRLLCYGFGFRGECSTFSQEYPPNKLRMRDTIYVAYKKAKEKYK